jgi:hypothetical protein
MENLFTVFWFLRINHFLVIRNIAGNKHNIAKNKISSRKKQEKSLMPDPATTGLTEKNLADISAFLLSAK